MQYMYMYSMCILAYLNIFVMVSQLRTANACYGVQESQFQYFTQLLETAKVSTLSKFQLKPIIRINCCEKPINLFGIPCYSQHSKYKV